jgi:hypothetical protein
MMKRAADPACFSLPEVPLFAAFYDRPRILRILEIKESGYYLQGRIFEYTVFPRWISRERMYYCNLIQDVTINIRQGKAMEKKSEKERMLASVNDYVSQFVTDLESGRKRVDDILKAMDRVDRKYFIDHDPYVDTALSIGHGQTISQPSTVARVLMLAELEPGHDVLEIGFGSGWNACLIAYLVYPGKVISAEIVPELVEQARKNLEKGENQYRYRGKTQQTGDHTGKHIRKPPWKI